MERSLDVMDWEERFNAAWKALLQMEARAEKAEASLAQELNRYAALSAQVTTSIFARKLKA